jgi:acyl-CoA thioester hydrolase
MHHNYSHDTKLRVRYGETDQMGYCYYGNYAQYFEVGRVETLRELGMSYKEMEKNGIMLPVSECHVKYIKPAHYDDELTITTLITGYKGPRIFFDYSIKNEQGELISTAHTTLVFVSKKTMRPIQPPESFITLINSKQD